MRAGRRVGEGRGICVSNSQCRDRIRARRRRRRSSRRLVQTLSRASRCRRRSDARCELRHIRPGCHRSDPSRLGSSSAAPLHPGPLFFGWSWTQIDGACWIRGPCRFAPNCGPCIPRTGPS